MKDIEKLCINPVIHIILSNLYTQHIFTKYLFPLLFNMSREIKSTNLNQVKCYSLILKGTMYFSWMFLEFLYNRSSFYDALNDRCMVFIK
jgi:hypothetical protein